MAGVSVRLEMQTAARYHLQRLMSAAARRSTAIEAHWREQEGYLAAAAGVAE